MSKIKEVLRLKYRNQLSNRQIQTMTGVSRNSVANYIKNYIVLGLTLDEILALSDKELSELFASTKPKKETYPKTLLEPKYSVEHQIPIIRNVGEDTYIKKVR